MLLVFLEYSVHFFVVGVPTWAISATFININVSTCVSYYNYIGDILLVYTTPWQRNFGARRQNELITHTYTTFFFTNNVYVFPQGADPNEPLGEQRFQEALKDGVLLCE